MGFVTMGIINAVLVVHFRAILAQWFAVLHPINSKWNQMIGWSGGVELWETSTIGVCRYLY